MKKTWLTMILGVCIALSAFSQPSFEVEQSKADSLREAGDLVNAIKEYDKIFKEDPTDRNSTYNYACALALSRQTDSAFKYLYLATASDSSVQALNDPDFYYLLQDERWSKFEDELVVRVEAKHGKYVNVELSKELWRMKMIDQAFYYQIDVASSKMGYQSPVVGALWHLKSQLNDKNVARIEEIIAEQGWPKRSIIKGSAASTVFLVIQHADIEIQEKYLPMMKEAANAGEASWSSLALLIDRVSLRQGKPQIYGSQITRDDDGTFRVSDLKEPEYVNQRRKEVGLPPIQDYVKHWDIIWTVEQKTK